MFMNTWKESLRERDGFEDLGIDGIIVLKTVIK
jgi:hypothetical protein